jgi:hypothetical protein
MSELQCLAMFCDIDAFCKAFAPVYPRPLPQTGRRAPCALGAFSRHLQGRRGPAQALVATAHKMARPVSHLPKDRGPYDDIGAPEPDALIGTPALAPEDRPGRPRCACAAPLRA